jgi:hypothetical protein
MMWKTARIKRFAKGPFRDSQNNRRQTILYRPVNIVTLRSFPPRKNNVLCGQGGSQFLVGLCAESTTNADTVTFPGLSLRPSCSVRAVKSAGPDPSSHVSMKSYEPVNPV